MSKATILRPDEIRKISIEVTERLNFYTSQLAEIRRPQTPKAIVKYFDGTADLIFEKTQAEKDIEEQIEQYKQSIKEKYGDVIVF